ncbi:hypothetical protein LCGC14_2455020 [marine sediment metagenome]|uniref:Uncharacterized protein n=1 Tax=marine sediment metagenome TaxID=412755 RepID=A0A0F9BEX5_9ZZZZ
MAKAVWLPKPELAPDVINLAITLEEAEALLAITGNIFGPEEGPRGATSRVYWTLKHIGITKEDIHLTGQIRLEAK